MNKLLTFVMLFMLISITADAQNEQRRRRPRFFKTDTLMVHDPVMAYEDGKYYIRYKVWPLTPEKEFQVTIPALSIAGEKYS